VLPRGCFQALLHCNRAAVLTKGERYADALADCNYAVTLDPKYDKALKRRADLYHLLEDYEAALADVKAMAKPNSELLRTLLSKSHITGGRDHYRLLGVTQEASVAEIKKAYHKLAMRHHPDKNPTSRAAAEALFKIIGEAHAVLSDKTERADFDRAVRRRQASSRTPSYTSSSYRRPPSPTGFYYDPYEASSERHGYEGYRYQQESYNMPNRGDYFDGDAFSTRKPRTQTQTCWTCGESGHLQRNCPYR